MQIWSLLNEFIRNFSMIVLALILVLIISILLNFYLFNRGQKYHSQFNLTRLDPLGLSVYHPQNNQKEKNQKLRVVFFGDSRAYQWPAPSGFDQFEFINRGIGAQTSAQAVERFDEHVVPLHPDILVIQMGINDLMAIPLLVDMQSRIISNCKDNIRRTVQKARNQGATVILTTIFPQGELSLRHRLFRSDDIGKAMGEINEFIYTLEEQKVIMFDTGQILADEKGLVRKRYSKDFLHLNKIGYEELNRILVKFLETLESVESIKATHET